nr:MAG TPA: hypothetical protein [Caudoviricetes sp.]
MYRISFILNSNAGTFVCSPKKRTSAFYRRSFS